jgi:hypothetical protein
VARDESSGACKPVAATGGGRGRLAEQPGRKRRCASSIAPSSHDRDGHSHPCCSALVPTRGARRSDTQRVVRGCRPHPPGTSCRTAGPNRPSRRRSGAAETWHEDATHEVVHGGADRGSTRKRYNAAPMARDAIVLDGGRMPASAQPDRSWRRPALSPPLDPARELYERASDALHATHQLAVASGTPDRRPRSLPRSSGPRLHWMRSHAPWTRCGASSSASALLECCGLWAIRRARRRRPRARRCCERRDPRGTSCDQREPRGRRVAVV